MKKQLLFIGAAVLGLSAQQAAAADLTPVGAEKGANADGTIPAWTGGRAKSDPMLARVAFGPYGSAQSGPSTTGPSASA